MSEVSDVRTIRIGVLGCGNVGAALIDLVRTQADAVEQRTGLRLEVATVAVRNVSAPRDVELDPSLLTHDTQSVVGDPGVDLVVEAIGGIEPARALILEALKNGKPVVTANKELLANCGAELYAAADLAGRDLLFEAAVAGGIPIMRALRESLYGEPITRVMGIINGTTNFILTKMTDAVLGGAPGDYHATLAEAQALGYAERDPTADVEGYDAGAKAAIIATAAFGTKVVAGDVYHEGISRVTGQQITIADRLGYCIKLLGIVERDAASDEVSVRVHPAMVPKDHPLASVRDSFNAVFVEGDFADSLMFFGRGAGGAPTASAVFGDVVDAALHLRSGTHGTLGELRPAAIRPIDETSAEYLLSLDVADEPGVLHAVTGVFAEHGVSIRAAEQEGKGANAQLVFITHTAREADVQSTVRALADLDVVKDVGGLIRVIAD
ncbi:MAG: homoserine dehydrogenase [Actinomycetota bacterium]